jgi:hypothetical protein
MAEGRSAVIDEFCGEIKSVLAHWAATVKAGDPDAINGFYLPTSKSSILASGITEQKFEGKAVSSVLKNDGEFVADSYSYIVTSDGNILVTGTGVWQNRRSSFTFVFQPSADPPYTIWLVNHMIFPGIQ